MTRPLLSVCIVNWNTREHLRACLQSIRDTVGEIAHETIVVDNASTDGSAEMAREEFPEVTLIANDENRYYAAGNNQALEAARGRYVLLLNPDVVLQPGAVAELLACMERHLKAGAVAPKLVHPDGSKQLSCRSFPDPAAVWYEALGLSRLFPRSRRFGAYRMSWWEHDDERTVDQPMASALLLRSEALGAVPRPERDRCDRLRACPTEVLEPPLRAVGHFDESFPMFFNDVDLCRRLWEAGWEVWFTPEARVIHHVGGSTRQVRPEMVTESHRSMLRYYEKHYRGRVDRVSYHATRALIRVGGALRGLAAR